MRRKSWIMYVVHKVVRLIVLLFAVCIVSFALVDASPIDPVTAYVGANPKVSIKQRKLIAKHWGLNKPPVERFFLWMKSIVQGDWGNSMIFRRPVLQVIAQKAANSAVLMFVAWMISGVIGFVLGILAGMNERRLIDRLICVICQVLRSTPSFWFGILMILVFSVRLGWFPSGLSVPIGVVSSQVTYWDTIRHMILPAITLGFAGISNICLHTRAKVIESMQSEYILYAKARGEKKRTLLFSHVIRNVSIPAITLQFLSFSELFGGAVFVEQVFSYPGLGQSVVSAGLKGDVPLLLGIVIISTIFVFTGNLIADFLYHVIDPRIRREGECT